MQKKSAEEPAEEEIAAEQAEQQNDSLVQKNAAEEPADEQTVTEQAEKQAKEQTVEQTKLRDH